VLGQVQTGGGGEGTEGKAAEEPPSGGTTSCQQITRRCGSYFTFKGELEAFIRDYGQGVSDRTLAQQIKYNCLSTNLALYVGWAWSPAAILETRTRILLHS
jgi:hypothetical protein